MCMGEGESERGQGALIGVEVMPLPRNQSPERRGPGQLACVLGGDRQAVSGGAGALRGGGWSHRRGCEQQHQAAGGGPFLQSIGDHTRQDPTCKGEGGS